MVGKIAKDLPEQDYNYTWPRDKDFKFVKKV